MKDQKQLDPEVLIEGLRDKKRKFMEESQLEYEYWTRMTSLQKLRTEYYICMLQEAQALQQLAGLKVKPKEDGDSKDQQVNKATE